jgi:cytosine/adenosine deaminase-related metal-dependent hydrolase
MTNFVTLARFDNCNHTWYRVRDMIIAANKIIFRVDRDPLEDHALLVRGSSIAAIGQRDRIIQTHSRDRIMRFEHGVLLPGLVNLHAHLELPALNTSHRSNGYASWVLSLLEAKAGLTVQDYISAARNNVRELIHSGTTTVAEISTHNVSPAVLKKSGLRAVVYHEIISMRPGSAVAFVPWRRDTTLIRHGLSPHSPHTVSEQALDFLHQYAKEHRLPLCMHVAESKDELLLFQGRKSGLDKLYAAAGWDRAWAPRAGSPFQYLDRLGMLGTGFLAVHAVQAGADDISIIARTGASVAHCPRSNRTLRVGTMDLRAMLDAGVSVGLGTDSLASSPTLNLWDEMRAAYIMHRLRGLTPADILNMATRSGAEALGMLQRIGTLEKGKQADCIVLPLPRKDTGNLCSDLLRETKSSIMTMVNGKVLYQNRNRYE